MEPTETTIDGILNKRVLLEQPVDGYRMAVDTVFLAAAVPALAGDHVLDLGCGVGGAVLALACRMPEITGVGIDIQDELIALFRRNIARNEFAAGLESRAGDVTRLPLEFAGVFDHVLMNPPYHDQAAHDVSPNVIKQTANCDTGDLAAWIASAALALKPSGTLTVIHRADRLDEILSCLQISFGDVEILPLLPKAWTRPKRVVIRARKGGLFSTRQCRPLVLHKQDGGYSDEAEVVLRQAQPLVFLEA